MKTDNHIKLCTTLKALLLLITVCSIEGIGLANCASIYFVDANIGDDEWSGKTNLMSGTDGPWRSLRRVTATTLKPGDTVILRCGSIWREPLMISGAGKPSALITIRAEDACAESARPEINLGVPLKGWIPVKGKIHASDVDFEVKQVFVDGQLLNKARYPENGFLYAVNGITATNPGSGSTGLIDLNLANLPEKDVDGVKAYIRTVGWLIEERDIASISGSQLNFLGATRYPVRKGAGYYLSNKFWMLSNGPGWYWSSLEKKLYVHLPNGASPLAHQIEVVQHDYGIQLMSQPYVNFSGIRIRQAGLDGVRVESSIQTELNNMEVVFSGRDGIVFSTESNGIIRDSLIRESGRDGILLWKSPGVKIIGNRVENSGTTGGPRNSLAAINATNSNYVHIERNTISGAGYIGIRFNRNSKVINNILYNTCLVLDDCGAIYSWANNQDTSPLNSVVIGNVVENVMGNSEGNADRWTLAAGIYLDDLTNALKVEDNTVINAERGIVIHNAFDNIIERNTIAYSRSYGVFVAVDYASAHWGELRANSIFNNTIINESVIPFIYYLDRVNREFVEVLKGNIYLGTRADNGFVIHRQGALGDIAEKFSPTSFQKLLGKESHGLFRQIVKTPTLLINQSTKIKNYPCNLSSDKDCANATNVMGHKINWPIRLQPFSSLTILH